MVVSERKFGRLLGAAALAAVTAGIAVPAVNSQGRALIQIDGSSTVFPVTEAVAEEFQKETRGRVNVTVGVSGSGGGFKKFCRGETDISNASRPIKDKEVIACGAQGISYIEMPIGQDALTVVINNNNDWAEELTVEQLKQIWEPDAQGSISNWNQVEGIDKDAPLNLFGPGADSGTFDYFTEAIVGEGGASRGDFTASEDDNVLVVGVENDVNALAYFGFAYYLENQDKLKAVAINGVVPSVETVESGDYTPLSRPLFIYVSKSALETKPEVKEFVNYYLDNANKFVSEVGYVARSEAAYQGLKRKIN